ncbi:unnamed protein product, partial [Cyprideis torosa]
RTSGSEPRRIKTVTTLNGPLVNSESVGGRCCSTTGTTTNQTTPQQEMPSLFCVVNGNGMTTQNRLLMLNSAKPLPLRKLSTAAPD